MSDKLWNSGGGHHKGRANDVQNGGAGGGGSGIIFWTYGDTKTEGDDKRYLALADQNYIIRILPVESLIETHADGTKLTHYIFDRTGTADQSPYIVGVFVHSVAVGDSPSFLYPTHYEDMEKVHDLRYFLNGYSFTPGNNNIVVPYSSLLTNAGVPATRRHMVKGRNFVSVQTADGVHAEIGLYVGNQRTGGNDPIARFHNAAFTGNSPMITAWPGWPATLDPSTVSAVQLDWNTDVVPAMGYAEYAGHLEVGDTDKPAVLTPPIPGGQYNTVTVEMQVENRVGDAMIDFVLGGGHKQFVVHGGADPLIWNLGPSEIAAYLAAPTCLVTNPGTTPVDVYIRLDYTSPGDRTLKMRSTNTAVDNFLGNFGALVGNGQRTISDPAQIATLLAAAGTIYAQNDGASQTDVQYLNITLVGAGGGPAEDRAIIRKYEWNHGATPAKPTTAGDYKLRIAADGSASWVTA